MATDTPPEKPEDRVFESIVELVLAGAGKEITAGDHVKRVLRRLYYHWIVAPGTNDDGTSARRPLDVWDEAEGSDLKEKFKEIGHRAGSRASSNARARFEHDDVLLSAFAVEDDSKCPWCKP